MLLRAAVKSGDFQSDIYTVISFPNMSSSMDAQRPRSRVSAITLEETPPLGNISEQFIGSDQGQHLVGIGSLFQSLCTLQERVSSGHASSSMCAGERVCSLNLNMEDTMLYVWLKQSAQQEPFSQFYATELRGGTNKSNCCGMQRCGRSEMAIVKDKEAQRLGGGTDRLELRMAMCFEPIIVN